MEIKVLARRGKSIRSIAKELELSRNTVRRVLRGEMAEPPQYRRAPRATKLDAYKAYLQERIAYARPQWIPAVVLLREIRERGYEGGITQLKVWLRTQRPAPKPEPVVRFETAPGQQMQADFTLIHKVGLIRLLVLVCTLGYSRASFVWFTLDETAQTLVTGLRAAFDYFGSVPKEVLFDNAKTIIIARDRYGEGQHRWGKELKDLAQECGFVPRVCRPYRARTKGKVERFNGYLKSSFIVPLAASLKASGLRLDVALANAHVGPWLQSVANARVHAETKAIPALRLIEERAHLLPAPALARAQQRLPLRVAPPRESLQHPLSVYEALVAPAPLGLRTHPEVAA